RPRDLAPDADVLGEFVRTMDTAMDRRPWAEPSTLFHLTGGLDSGTIATRAAERHPGRFATSTLLGGGRGRDTQHRRRAQVRTALPFADAEIRVDGMSALPLSRECVRSTGALISPYEAPIHLAFSEMARAVAKTGGRTVVTGLGGDEMVALTQEERPGDKDSVGAPSSPAPWIGAQGRQMIALLNDGIAPPALVNSVTLQTLETTAPVLLREGLWPVHPFTDPGMVKFGEQLPF